MKIISLLLIGLMGLLPIVSEAQVTIKDPVTKVIVGTNVTSAIDIYK